MLHTGLEKIFTGDGGAATYLFVVVAAALLYLARTHLTQDLCGRRPVRRFFSGILLLVVSRFIYVYRFGNSLSWPLVLSFVLAGGGLYFLVESMLEKHGDFGVGAYRKRHLLLVGVCTGGVTSIALTLLLSSRFSGGAFVPLVVLFMIWAPAGFVTVVFGRSNGCRSKWMPALLCGSICLVAATIITGFTALGILNGDPFWRQLFMVIDLAGFFSLCVASVCTVVCEDARVRSAGDREADDVGRSSDADTTDTVLGVAIHRIRDIACKSARNIPCETIYDEITGSILQDAGVDFVLLRVSRTDDDYYKVVSCAGPEYRNDEHFSGSVTLEIYQALCREDRSCGNGFVLGWDDMDGDRGSFVGSSRAWDDKTVFVVPVRGHETVRGFFVVGFFEAEPAASMHEILDLYANMTYQIIQRDRCHEMIREKERTLAAYREDLESVNQLKSNFMSIVSHELRTPLTSVKAYTETLLDNLGSVDRSTIKDFLRVMDEESERLIKLVDNILNYSYMETGLLKVEKTPCNINEIIEDVLEALQPVCLEKRVNCEMRLPRHSVLIDADLELIQQLLQNLLGNAVKFTPPDGKVTVTLEEEAAAARIIVQDTGKGIPENQLEKIFERFHQADASNTREYGGSGLGLAICKNIVNWHDGQIWVENVKDAGAKFVVLLPMNNIVVRQAASSGFISSVRFERERYLTLLVEMLSEILQSRKASIMLLDVEERVLRIVASKGLDPEFVENTRLEIGDRIAGRVFQTGESVHVSDIEKDLELGRANNSMFYGTHSFICVPLRNEEKIIGVVNVSDHIEGREFTGADRELLETLGAVISGMLNKLDAFEKVSSNFENLKEAMRRILEIRETWGSRNLTNLTLIALEVGRRLDLNEKSLTALRLGMNLYDLGMMKVPRSIRGKREELTEKEWSTLHGHPDAGYKLVSPMGLGERIMKMVRSHHENFDGSGYPDRLTSKEIPIEARIVNVVDTFRALITQGPHRRSHSLDEARNEIIKGSGTKFDPKVVSAFVKALHDLGAVEDHCELVLTTVERELKKQGDNERLVRTVEDVIQSEEPVKEGAP